MRCDPCKLREPPTALVPEFESVMNALRMVWSREAHAFEALQSLACTVNQRELTMERLRQLQRQLQLPSVERPQNEELFDIAF